MHDQHSVPFGIPSQQSDQPFPLITSLLIAAILSLRRWIDWASRCFLAVISSPQFATAVKRAGATAGPVIQTAVGEVWKWYTSAEQWRKLAPLEDSRQPCHTSQSLSFGLSMPGVTINMQYQATNNPTARGAVEANSEDAKPPEAVTATDLSAVRLPVTTREAPTSPPSPSTVRQAFSSISTVSRQMLAVLPAQAPLYPLRLCSTVWNAARLRDSAGQDAAATVTAVKL